MTYEEWQKLSSEQQAQVPDSELPEVPTQMLRNGLIWCKAERKQGVPGWRMVQKVKDSQTEVWLPEIKTRTLTADGMTTDLYYRLEPETGAYIPQISGTEKSTEEEPIGMFGRLWMQWMEENYPEKVDWMRFQHNYLTVARSVESRARAYQEMLETRFEEQNPRPTDFNRILAWEQQKKFEVENLVIRDEVHRPVTTP